jgi:hypothetical protein
MGTDRGLEHWDLLVSSSRHAQVGRRPVGILTYDGLMPMAASLQSSRLDPRVALSDKIQGAITAATTEYGGSHAANGWQVVYHGQV